MVMQVGTSSAAVCLETLPLVTEPDASGMTFPCEF